MDEYNSGTQSGGGAAAAMPLKLDVKVRPIEPSNNLMAFASVTVNDCLKIHGFKIVDSEKGLFVNMPSAKTNQMDENGKPKFQDVAHPINSAFREQLVTAILDGYDAAIGRAQEVVRGAQDKQRAPMKRGIGDQIQAHTVRLQDQQRGLPDNVAAKKRENTL